MLLTLLAPALVPTPAGVADISIFGASVEANDVETSAGANITVSFRASNGGSVELEDVTIGYYLSTDTVFDGSDVAMEFEDVSVDVGEIEDENEQITVPGGTAAGCYYVLVVADPFDALAESDESNNSDDSEIAVDVSLQSCGGSLPDIVPENAALSATRVTVGSSVTASVTSANIGDATASDVEVFYYLSEDDRYDVSVDTYLSFDEADFLFAGATEDEIEPLTIPAGTAPGRYYVVFAADGGDDIVESDETNNVAAVPLTVLDPSVSLYGEDLGGPHVGTLLTLETPTAGAPLTLEVSGFPTSTFALVWASFDTSSIARFDGTILADPYTPEVWTPFNVAGDPQTVTVDLPAGMSGSTLYAQAMARDASQSDGVAFTNGLSIVLP